MLKPPNYDGTGSTETFLAQFQNCASYNKWTKKEQLVYLRSSLEKDAGQVLWDYSAETTALLTKMITRSSAIAERPRCSLFKL